MTKNTHHKKWDNEGPLGRQIDVLRDDLEALESKARRTGCYFDSQAARALRKRVKALEQLIDEENGDTTGVSDMKQLRKEPSDA